MPRALIVAVVVIVVLTVYAVVDCAMTDQRRTRVLQKPIWLVVVLLLPVVGPALWMLFGKQPRNQQSPAPTNPDSDRDYLERLSRDSAHDSRIRELEEEMRKLDEEIEQARQDSMRDHPSTGSLPTIPPEPNGDDDNNGRNDKPES